MKSKDSFILTQKEIPSEAVIPSHKLMLRAGLISALSSGLYTYLPLGFRVLRKISTIVREEMDKSGALEILMPTLQPAELWRQTGRWEAYGDALFTLTDRRNRDFCLGPTHEEVITQLAAKFLKSYKQLPINFYQIQTKFRDETRPRFGVMRASEFIMKDAYSFHLTEESLEETYQLMRQTYGKIFDRLGLDYRAVSAVSGEMGGNVSCEFHVMTDAGEDEICFSEKSDYASNIELCPLPKIAPDKSAAKERVKVETPGMTTIRLVSDFLGTKEDESVKTILVEREDGGLQALVLRGDHQLNPLKVERVEGIKKPMTMADEVKIKEVIGCSVGSIGVVDLPVPMIVDYSAAVLTNFICGANEEGVHYMNVNWVRDVGEVSTLDIRKAVAGDPSPDGGGRLVVKRGVEVGHIFQLGDNYSTTLGANIIQPSGKPQAMHMGCYGIGVSRLLAAIIEQHHDDHGIVFPPSVAPYQIIIVPVNYVKSTRVREYSNAIYQTLNDKGIEVILDNRHERAGILFADSELLGIPHSLIISDGHMDRGTVEYQCRRDRLKQDISQDEILNFLYERLTNDI